MDSTETGKRQKAGKGAAVNPTLRQKKAKDGAPSDFGLRKWQTTKRWATCPWSSFLHYGTGKSARLKSSRNGKRSAGNPHAAFDVAGSAKKHPPVTSREAIPRCATWRVSTSSSPWSLSMTAQRTPRAKRTFDAARIKLVFPAPRKPPTRTIHGLHSGVSELKLVPRCEVRFWPAN